MTQIVRIFTDCFLFLIRINPYNLYDLCSIFGCGLAALCTTHRPGAKTFLADYNVCANVLENIALLAIKAKVCQRKFYYQMRPFDLVE
jgi:hypothetical protein